ncbi:MAG: hypothetical protein AMJ92_11400 [candidate division Zixibacteria bacterium SM23_81]|nr:MAG: hypothetical protein AMJ92_11400 [candidate division Zixibacteria bacterium SM23_81]
MHSARFERSLLIILLFSRFMEKPARKTWARFSRKGDRLLSCFVNIFILIEMGKSHGHLKSAYPLI